MSGKQHVLRGAALASGALILLIVVVIGGIAGWQSISGPSSPSAVAVADIPADYLSLYEREAARPSWRGTRVGSADPPDRCRNRRDRWLAVNLRAKLALGGCSRRHPG